MCAFQIPRKDHPWRQYQDKKDLAMEHPQPKKTIKVFLTEITANWDNIEVFTTAYGREDRHLLSTLPSYKQATWILSLIKKSYL